MTTQYLALLRGINVGGNNIIKMSDLKKCFETMFFTHVETSKISALPVYKNMTIRNWNTTTKLFAMMEKRT